MMSNSLENYSTLEGRVPTPTDIKRAIVFRPHHLRFALIVPVLFPYKFHLSLQVKEIGFNNDSNIIQRNSSCMFSVQHLVTFLIR